MTLSGLREKNSLSALTSALDRHKGIVALSYSLIFILASLLVSATKLMWFDELATYYPQGCRRSRTCSPFSGTG